MSIIVVLDTETTGIDPLKDQVTEFAFASVDIESAKVIDIYSVLYSISVPNPMADLTGIPERLSSTYGLAMGPITPNRLVPEAFVAHNASFDKSFIYPVMHPNLQDIPWLCTRLDWKWPKTSNSQKLVDLALAHGVAVTSAHRAFSDVLTLCSLLERVHEGGFLLKDQLDYAKLPRSKYRANVSFDQKHLAKTAGFAWEPAIKTWWKNLTDEEAGKIQFSITKIPPPKGQI